ncbi:hypothetical protein JCM8097_002212 [Rhodosporidiobolus ruineniae]
MRAKRRQRLKEAQRAAQLAAQPSPPSPPPGPPPRPPPALPSELIDLILEQLALGLRARKADLAACCLVSRTFLDLARPRLYRIVELHLTSISNGGLTTNAWVDYSTFSVIRVLRDREHLRPFVQTLDIGAWQPPPLDRQRLDLYQELYCIFQNCPNLVELWVGVGLETSTSFPLLQLREEGRAPPITRIKVRGVCQMVEILARVLIPGALKHIDLVSSTLATGVVPSALDHYCLSHLSLRPPSEDPHPFLEKILTLSSSTLTTLTFRISAQTLPALPSFARFPSLRHLVFFLRGDQDRTPLIQGLPPHLRGCGALERLSIHPTTPFTLSNIRTLSSPTPSGLAANLPASLLALHLHSPLFHPSDLLSLVRASPQAVNLRQLGREPYRLPLGERDRKKRPSLPSDEEIDELNEVCRARGITVVALPGGNNE